MAIAVASEQVCRYCCLGSVVLYDASGEPRAIRTRKQAALLLFLARRTGRPIGRDELIELLWSSHPEKAAKHSLSQTVSLINKSLGCEAVVTSGRERLVLREGVLTLDVNEFERLARSGEYDAAMKLWRGTLFDGLYVQRAPNFERWLSDERAAQDRVFRRLVHLRLDSLKETGQYPAMRDESEVLLQLDPLDEKAMLVHLEALTLLDDRSLALRRYRQFEDRIRSELEAEPGESIAAWAKRNRKSGIDKRLQTQGPTRVTEVMVLPSATPVFGRREEFSILWNAWETSRRTTGSLIVVEGDAGIGKTALVTKLANQVHVAGGSVCFVTCYGSEIAVPFAPITALVRQLSRLPGFVALDPVWIGELARLAPELRERYPHAPVPMVVDDAARHRLCDAVLRAIVSVADEQTLLLSIDDLQDADEPSLALIHYLCRQLEQQIMIVGVRRTGRKPSDYEKTFISSLSAAGTCRILRIGAMESADIERLVQQVAALKGWALTAETLVDLMRQSGGNPLHAIEGTLAAGQPVAHGGDPSSQEHAIKEGFAETAVRRILALPAGPRLLAGTLAVCGHPLSEYELAEATSLKPGDLSVAIAALEAAKLVTRTGARIRLSHDRYSAVVNGVLERDERAGIHARLANLIAKSAATNPAAHYQVAKHYEATGALAEAASSARAAFRFAAEIGAVRNEVDALRLLRRVSQDAGDEVDITLAHSLLEMNCFNELDSLCKEIRGRTLASPTANELTYLEIAADFESGRAPMQQLQGRLQDLLASPDDFAHRPAAVFMLVKVADKKGDYRLALRTARELRRRDGRSISPDRHALLAAGLLIAKYFGARRVLPILERAVQSAQACNDWPLESYARDVVGVALKMVGRFRESIEHFNASLVFARKMLNPHAEARCLQNRVVSEMVLGDDERTMETLDEADKLPHESWAFRGFNVYNRGIVKYWARDYADAISYLETACSIAVRHGMHYLEADCHAGVALAQLRLGNLDAFTQRTRKAVEVENPSNVMRNSWIIPIAMAWYMNVVEGNATGAIALVDELAARMKRCDVAFWLTVMAERLRLLENTTGKREERERAELRRLAASYEAGALLRYCQA